MHTPQHANAALHVLQSTLPPVPGLPEGLYLRLTDPAHRPAQICTQGGTDPLGVALRAGQVLSTDTFFGSFYLAHWRAHTRVRQLALRVTFSGHGVLRVFGDGPQGVRLLHAEPLEGAAQHPRVIPVSLSEDPARPPPGRLFMEIEASGAGRVHALDIVTAQPPLRRATLSIGLCTFNQERLFARTLAAVVELAQATDVIGTIHVVNQGAPFADPEIRSLLETPGVMGVQQRNLGGCGGFTRTLMDAMAAPAPSSHHLLMDDDIVLDPRLILRAVRFLDHAEGDIALGAGMIDALAPTVMYEAGAFLRPDNTIEPHARNVDLTAPGGLGPFNAPAAVDYNAWWFCILPLARCRAVGLPAPVFIRGDDFEYGQRLGAAGVPTVTLPGIAVWHAPFHAKPQGWQHYYDLRNRLIFAATHAGRVRQLSLAHVVGLMTTAILTHAHGVAALRLRAVDDFLVGPDLLFARDPEVLHAGIMALAQADPPDRLEDRAWAAVPTAPARPRRPDMAGLIAQHMRALLRTGLWPLERDAGVVLRDVDVHPANTAGRAYVLTNGPRSFHLRMVPRRGRMWWLLVRTAAMAVRYRLACARANQVWAQGIARYRTQAWWVGFLGLPKSTARNMAPSAPLAPQSKVGADRLHPDFRQDTSA